MEGVEIIDFSSLKKGSKDKKSKKPKKE